MAAIEHSADELRADGTFVRQEYTIRDRITADGSSGFPAERGRYHLYVALSCPWGGHTVQYWSESCSALRMLFQCQ